MHVQGTVVYPDLLLTQDGPGGMILRRLRLAPQGFSTPRGALVLAAIAWLPLLVFSTIEGHLVGGVAVPFLRDIGAHVRFLLGVPLLMLTEAPIGTRLREIAAQFIVAGLVREDEQPRFAEILAETLRLRDASFGTLVVIAGAGLTTFGAMTEAPVHAGNSWHAVESGSWLAASWFMFVSLPIVQFLVYRWVYRTIVWATFLFKVSRLRLLLTPTHPDGAGGLGFVGKGSVPFGLLVFAISTVMASAIATKVLFDHAALATFYAPYGTLLVVLLVAFNGPLLVFMPLLARVKHQGLLQYGVLASRYTQLFGRKWLSGADVSGDPLLGSGDIQSLADLGNAYGFIEKMRFLPVGFADFIAIVVPGILPALPLLALVMPVADIVKQLVHLLL